MLDGRRSRLPAFAWAVGSALVRERRRAGQTHHFAAPPSGVAAYLQGKSSSASVTLPEPAPVASWVTGGDRFSTYNRYARVRARNGYIRKGCHPSQENGTVTATDHSIDIGSVPLNSASQLRHRDPFPSTRLSAWASHFATNISSRALASEILIRFVTLRRPGRHGAFPCLTTSRPNPRMPPWPLFLVKPLSTSASVRA